MTQQMLFYTLGFLILLGLYIVWSTVGSSIVKCYRAARKLDESKQQQVESDFYECVNYRTLSMELEDALKLQKSLERLDQSFDETG